MARNVKMAQRVAEKKKKREKELREERARRQERQITVTSKKVIEKAPELPIIECLISKGWKERGLAHILLARRLGPGRVSAAGYYVDIFCLGLRNTALLPAMKEEEYHQNVKPNVFNDPVDFEDCAPGVAKAVVEGAIAFSEKYGFRPNKRWSETRRFLDGIEADATGLIFGKEGTPCLVVRGGDAAAGAVARLERTAGPGNYTVEKEPVAP
jgi:hypothetical protein